MFIFCVHLYNNKKTLMKYSNNVKNVISHETKKKHKMISFCTKDPKVVATEIMGKQTKTRKDR